MRENEITKYEMVIIGGGPAGLAAAIEAKNNGINDIIIIERDSHLGGILNQCIHTGFGLHYFKEELTGPEYSQRFIDKVESLNIEFKLNTMVVNISKDKIITAVNSMDGIIEIEAKTIILAMGCRERPRGAIRIPGSRCAGVYTAGTAQRLVNIEGIMPGKEVVILGSGDIGLIMARRMTLEGAKVKAVLEIMPYSSGLKRNIVQCLDDYNIPLMLNHTIVEIKGDNRVEYVKIVKVDENLNAIAGSEELISCDTVLFSVGLIPETDISKGLSISICENTGGPEVDTELETNIPGVFACGNVLHVHDLVDNVTLEGTNAGFNASKYHNKEYSKKKYIEIVAGTGIKYTVPHYISIDNLDQGVSISFRVSNLFENSYLSVNINGNRVINKIKKILTPGEMEHIFINREVFEKFLEVNEMVIKIEK